MVFTKFRIFAKFSHFAFSRNFASFSLNIFSRKNAKFREKVCEMRPKIFAFFRETFRSLETLVETRKYALVWSLKNFILERVVYRAGRVPGGTIVLSWERTERSRTTPSFRKKNERLERVLKNIGTFSKRTERNGTGIAWKERLKSLTRSYYQERVLSWERILNQECVLIHLEIVSFFYSIPWPPSPHFKPATPSPFPS